LYFPTEYIEVIQFALLGLFLLGLIVQLAYYLFLFSKIYRHKATNEHKKQPISVIICARNEAENLRNNLPSVLEQKHENYEVIVVNDCSTDDTEDVILGFQKKYKNLRTTIISPDKKFSHGKKLALTLGIKASKNEWLVFTDADCKPLSDKWLSRLQDNFSDSTEIVLGLGKYSHKKGFLNAYIRYDTLMIAMQYLSFALAGQPYMGVGRNLAYRKSLFFNNKGFASHYDLLSGDDDLFVNETATKENTSVEFSYESHTISEPKKTWGEWYIQKSRHLSTADRYKAKHLFWLGLEPFTRLLFYLSFIALISLNLFILVALSALALRLICQLIIIKLTMKRFNETKLLLWTIIFDLISLFINFNIYLSTKFRRKKSRWK
jgi:biofilm PGA synthesis N-glycosyltransferase PgaC